MIKYVIAAAALVVAGIPAAFGLAGNASFTRDIPVRVPEQVQLTPAASTDDDGTADQGHGDAPGTPGADDQNDDNDDEDFIAITKIINGGTAGLKSRQQYWARARAALGIAAAGVIV